MKTTDEKIYIKLNKPNLYMVKYNNDIIFEHEGIGIGILIDNGTIKWINNNIKESLKKECRDTIRGLLNNTTTVITSKPRQ